MRTNTLVVIILLLGVCLQDQEAPINNNPTTDGLEAMSANKSFNPQGILEFWPSGSTHQSARVALRDGKKMATEVFLPPGDGSFPTLLIRSLYGRGAAADRSKKYADKNIAFVVQDPRGRGDSEGTIDPLNNENEIEDAYDTLDWISKQAWCNGRIGMFGGSGHGKYARMAYLSKHLNLKVVFAANTTGNTYLYSFYENGVRKNGCHGITFRNGKPPKSFPGTESYDFKPRSCNRARWA